MKRILSFIILFYAFCTISYAQANRKIEEIEVPSGYLFNSDRFFDSFFFSKYPINQNLFELLMKYNPSNKKGPKYPVVNVNWYEAADFVTN